MLRSAAGISKRINEFRLNSNEIRSLDKIREDKIREDKNRLDENDVCANFDTFWSAYPNKMGKFISLQHSGFYSCNNLHFYSALGVAKDTV